MVQRKVQQGSYQVSKQDADELLSVCKVMEDLIRFQDSLFTVSTLVERHIILSVQ